LFGGNFGSPKLVLADYVCARWAIGIFRLNLAGFGVKRGREATFYRGRSGLSTLRLFHSVAVIYFR
jgi:hypothetical protein